jgi:hypothetical protein
LTHRKRLSGTKANGNAMGAVPGTFSRRKASQAPSPRIFEGFARRDVFREAKWGFEAMDQKNIKDGTPGGGHKPTLSRTAL